MSHSVLGRFRKAIIDSYDSHDERAQRIADLEALVAEHDVVLAVERAHVVKARAEAQAERADAAAEAQAERARTAAEYDEVLKRAAERVLAAERDTAIAERKALDYYDVVRAFEVQRDEWKRMFIANTTTNANAQAYLEDLVGQAVQAFNRAIAEVNVYRGEKGLPPAKPAEFAPTTSARFRREMRELHDGASPLLAADEAQAMMRANAEPQA